MREGPKKTLPAEVAKDQGPSTEELCGGASLPFKEVLEDAGSKPRGAPSRAFGE